MNFLPEKDKILIKKEYFKRTVVISGVFFVCIMAAVIALLFPSFLFLHYYGLNFNNQITSSAKELSTLNTKGLIEEIKKINSKARLVENKKDETKLNQIFAKIISFKTASVKITGLSYKKSKDKTSNRIAISGKAGLRQDFIFFEKNLRKEFGEKAVESPVSNLLKEKNLDFSLLVNLAYEK